MSHKHFQKAPQSFQKQNGAALAVAVFIIVVMGLIGMAMVRILGDSSQAIVSEVYGTRAQAAARTGAELFLTELFPHDSPVATTLCPARTSLAPPEVSPEQTFTISGLAGCSVTVYCDRADFTTPHSGTHFRIISEGQCQVGESAYSKVLMLEASDEVL